MLEKLKQKAVKMNFKKIVIAYLLVGIVISALSGVLLYNNFKDRADAARAATEKQWQEYVDSIQETKEQLFDETANQSNSNFEDARHPYFYGTHRRDNGMYNHYDWDLEKSGEYENQMKAIWNLTTTDYILLGSVFVIAFLLAGTYWVLCIVWTVRKAERSGANTGIWALAALFGNLWAVAALYLYTFAKGTCKVCGHIKGKGNKFCSHCGNAFQKKCPECGNMVNANEVYCPECGKNLNETK